MRRAEGDQAGCYWGEYSGGPALWSMWLSSPCSPPVGHSHLQHCTDPATSQHLQQACEMCEALWGSLHLPLEIQSHVIYDRRWEPRTQAATLPPPPGQVLTSGSLIAESNPAEMSTSSGSNCGQDSGERLEQDWQGTLPETSPTPQEGGETPPL